MKRSKLEYPWLSWIESTGPRASNHGAGAGVLMAEGDGLRPPGTDTGDPCQAAMVLGAAGAGGRDFLRVAIAALRATFMAA